MEHLCVQSRDYHEVTGNIICPNMVRGIDHLRDPRLNKVTAEVSLCFFCDTNTAPHLDISCVGDAM